MLSLLVEQVVNLLVDVDGGSDGAELLGDHWTCHTNWALGGLCRLFLLFLFLFVLCKLLGLSRAVEPMLQNQCFLNNLTQT